MNVRLYLKIEICGIFIIKIKVYMIIFYQYMLFFFLDQLTWPDLNPIASILWYYYSFSEISW